MVIAFWKLTGNMHHANELARFLRCDLKGSFFDLIGCGGLLYSSEYYMDK